MRLPIKNQSNSGYSYINETLQVNVLQWCIDNKIDVVLARNLLLGNYTNKSEMLKKMNNGFPVYDKDSNFTLTSKLLLSHNVGVVGCICALLKQQKPNLNVTSFKNLSPSVCENMGDFEYFGYEIIKAGII